MLNTVNYAKLSISFLDLFRLVFCENKYLIKQRSNKIAATTIQLAFRHNVRMI